MNVATVVGIFGAIALGALILGIIWWMRALDRKKSGSTDGISAAFKGANTDESRRR